MTDNDVSILDLPVPVRDLLIAGVQPKADDGKPTWREAMREAKRLDPDASWRTHKTCSRCGWFKPHAEFTTKSNYCKPCRVEYNREWRERKRGGSFRDRRSPPGI